LHYALPLSVSTLADVAHVSGSYLVKRFRGRTGISLMRYVQDVRVQEAERLLVTTDEPVAQIARKVGFADPLYFSRVFRRATGHSPTAMRQVPVAAGRHSAGTGRA
jgi:AraC-like DNA-binding protein